MLTLPKPYSHLKSDQIKRWNKQLIEGEVIGADNEAEQELFKCVSFTNALVLKINQLAKQVIDQYNITPRASAPPEFFYMKIM